MSRDRFGRLGPAIGEVAAAVEAWRDRDSRPSGRLRLTVASIAESFLFVLRERYVVAMRRGHPVARGFDLDRWLAWPHVVVSAEGDSRTPLDDALAGIGRERRVGMVVPSFLLVPDLRRSSDLVALVPSLTITRPVTSDLITFEPPLVVDGFELHLAWHRRRERDRVVLYVGGEIRRLLSRRPAWLDQG